ncbi:MAG TPA: Hpt domain-containing protein [Devosia sp.]|nr:Hpt domain-containing protein [Devosia sp.]
MVSQVLRKSEKTEERPAQRPIDMVHLSRQSLGDPGLEEEILRMFDQLAAAYVGRLRGAVKDDDTLLSLHSLKGASAGVGARAIASLTSEAEAEFRLEGKLSGERLADISMAVEEVRTYISELLGD